MFWSCVETARGRVTPRQTGQGSAHSRHLEQIVVRDLDPHRDCSVCVPGLGGAGQAQPVFSLKA